VPEDTSHQFALPEVTVLSGTTTTLGQTYFPLSSAHVANPYACYARARLEEPVFFSPFLNAWVVTRYEDVVAVLRDHQRFAAALRLTGVEKLTPEVVDLLRTGPLYQVPSLLFLDPPEHTRLRGCLTKAFSAQRVATLEPQIRVLANRLIDHFPSSGQMDFMECFAWSYPILVIGRLLNVPEGDMEQIQRWSQDMMTLIYAAPPPELQLVYVQHMLALQHYIHALAEDHRTRPQDDLISDLYRSMEDGQAPLTPLEVAGILHVLLIAGFETTTKFLGNCMFRLLSDRSCWEAIVTDSSRIPPLVEEALRFDPPGLATLRIAKEDVVIGGKCLQKGDRVQVVLASANHDEALFSDPETFHYSQESAPRHLAFGYGVHFCIGAPLARLESRVALEQLCQRLPSLRLIPGQEISYAPNLIFRGLKQLLVEWDRDVLS
jgi:cytochrome P450